MWNITRYTALIVALTGALLLAAACGDDDEAGVDDDDTASPSPTTHAGPDIRGEITQRLDGNGETIGTILIEGEVQPDTEYDKASVRIDAETELTTPSGATLTWDDLVLGATVEATFEGPVAESYPVQAYASKIVVLAVPDATP
jgi:hypothetical protein